MFNLEKFIADSVTFRPISMFAPDIETNKDKLTQEIRGKKVCVISGAGRIGLVLPVRHGCIQNLSGTSLF